MKQRKSLKIIIVILLLLITAFVYNMLFKKPVNNDNDDKKNDKHQYKLEVEDYTVYDLKDLDFRFVVADITNKNRLDESIAIKNLIMNDQIIGDYKSKIEEVKEKEYVDLDLNNLSDSLDLNLDSYKIFIPVEDYNLNSIEIKNSDEVLFKINLEENITSKLDVLKDDEDSKQPEEPKDEVIDKEKYKLEIGTTYRDQNFVYIVDGEEFQSSSKETLHIVPIQLFSNDGNDYTITEAKFDFDDYPGDMDAQDNFEVYDTDNLLNKNTSDKIKGGIIFITYAQPEGNIEYSGTLKLLINDSEWIEFKVVL